jgi:diguanylate cyclase (GGDEF)-like protein
MIEQAIRIIRVLLGNTTSVTREQIEESVNQVLQMPNFSTLEKKQLIREIESIYSVRIEDYRIIEREDRKIPWLNAKKVSISWDFWNRYRTYLQDEKNFAPDTLNKLDRLTERILDSLFDPTAKIEIDKKGLVVGQVQSGKTSNYIGLICKAADAGFKLIIVLAGIHNNLRSQTQLRIDEGFLGFDTQYTRAFNQNNIWIGVGKINRNVIAHSLTSSVNNGDFTQGAANALGLNFNTNEPIIAVVKKNPHVLRKLYRWLSAQAVQEENGHRKVRNKSLLLIDDEADNASINISNDPEQRSTINNWITSIIALFGKSGYVGYTATPFANIFIPLEEDNLFPRDFIINIPPPSNYIGPERVFGFRMIEENEESDSVIPIVNRIDDYSDFVPDKHKLNDQLPSSIPESLKTAIRCFILTCAIRRVRGQINVHNSMLIHVSRFQRWQDHITELVQNWFDYYRMGINQNDSDIFEEFRRTFEEDTDSYRSYVTISNKILNSPLKNIDPNVQVHSWKEVLPYLNEAASIVEAKYTLNLMKENSLTDQMTGLYNRRYLEEILDKIAASTIREKSLLGILMVDVDYFKKVNDTYGHDAGDAVLKELAKTMINSVRESDFVVRFGGEEFIIILQNIKDEEGIVKVAEKIRETFANTKVSINGKTLTKTISVGVSIFPKHTTKIWEAIKYADLALYEAKNSGRNKVVLFTPKLLESVDYEGDGDR